MRRNLIPSLANVNLDNTSCVDWIALVGIYYNTEQSGVGLKNNYSRYLVLKENLNLSFILGKSYIDQFSHISGFQIPQDRSLIEISQVRNIIEFLHLGRVDLLHLG